MSFNRYIQIKLLRPVDPNVETTVTHEGRDTFYITISSVLMEGIILNPLIRTSFKLRTASTGWEGSVYCSNLSNASREFLQGGEGGLKKAIIEVDAGYEDNHAVIWRGGLSDIRDQRKKSDVVTEFVLGRFLPVFRDGKTYISYDKAEAVSGMDIITEELKSKSVEYSVNIDKNDIWKDSFVTRTFSGSLIEFIRTNVPSIRRLNFVNRWVPKSEGSLIGRWLEVPLITHATYSISTSGVVFIHWEDEPPEKYVLLIDESSGLIDSPRAHTKGKKTLIKARVMFTPFIRKGGTIRLKSKTYPEKDGDYTVLNITMSGTNGNGTHDIEMDLRKVI